ncbi:MAG TPA: DNA/RNA non-specific endonuclease [Candidatus Tidjanibacter gallistercoris]|nr:DNA/RNA non-specific endonuclease [Candidatus Tidjanibacter gallistercoris]
MEKWQNDIPRKELRRSRMAGTVLFFLLAAAGCWYYSDFMRIQDNAARPYTVAERNVPLPEESVPTDTSRKAQAMNTVPRQDDAAGPTTISGTGASWEHTGPLELPAFTPNDIILDNRTGRYTLRYDTTYRQAAWVAYVLTGSDTETGKARRRDRFVPDPAVVRNGYPTAFTSGYKGSGYDRGHLCPSADRTRTQEENDCTFYLSNIAPQTPALNRGPWKELEEQVRRWALRCDTLYIVAGGVLTPGLDTLPSGIGIPEYFYKAILAKKGTEFRAIGFLLPNAARFENGYEDYVVTIDSLQTFTSLDFYRNLPDSIEKQAESTLALRFWFDR